jgi:hypothetical protein
MESRSEASVVVSGPDGAELTTLELSGERVTVDHGGDGELDRDKCARARAAP